MKLLFNKSEVRRSLKASHFESRFRINQQPIGVAQICDQIDHPSNALLSVHDKYRRFSNDTAMIGLGGL